MLEMFAESFVKDDPNANDSHDFFCIVRTKQDAVNDAAVAARWNVGQGGTSPLTLADNGSDSVDIVFSNLSLLHLCR